MRYTKNEVNIIGFLGKDPLYTQTGQSKIPFASLSVATNDTFKTKDENGDYSYQTKPTFHKVVCWRKVAEIAYKYLSKGSYVSIKGKIIKNEHADGSYSLEILAFELGLLETKNNKVAISGMSEKSEELLNEVVSAEDNDSIEIIDLQD